MKIFSSFYFTTCFLCFFITGCDAYMGTTTSVTKLLSPLSESTANLSVEVSSCTDYEDSRKPSSSLLEVQNEIPNIFHGAQYVQCYRKKFESFADFKIPVGIGQVEDVSNLKDIKHDINILSDKYSLLVVQTSDDLAKRIQKLLKQKSEKLNLNILLKIKNDLDKDINVTYYGMYMQDSEQEGTPITVANGIFNKNTSLVLKLSDVSTSYLYSAKRISNWVQIIQFRE